MDFLKNSSWQEVFSSWKDREAQNPGWIRVATELKGWPDWESWRSFTAEQLGAEKRRWSLHRFDNPGVQIPQMLVGPFGGWQNELPENQKNLITFDELIRLPGQAEKWLATEKISKMIPNLPFETNLIGIIRKDTGKIVCLDGHHRAMAITLAQRQENPPNFSSVPTTIYLSELEENETDLLDLMLKRGTVKNPAPTNTHPL